MILFFIRYGAELNVEDYRLFAMALTQRYVKPTKEIFVITQSVSQLFLCRFKRGKGSSGEIFSATEQCSVERKLKYFY